MVSQPHPPERVVVLRATAPWDRNLVQLRSTLIKEYVVEAGAFFHSATLIRDSATSIGGDESGVEMPFKACITVLDEVLCKFGTI